MLAIAQRDLVKLLRDRPRLAVNLAFPILLVAGLGSVLQPAVGKATGVSAVTATHPLTARHPSSAGVTRIVRQADDDAAVGRHDGRHGISKRQGARGGRGAVPAGFGVPDRPIAPVGLPLLGRRVLAAASAARRPRPP
jgi:hypothetical protein